ncbi:MAG: hypothetical protein D6814_11510 [Calditrichaeota bacterium]|nr:MAG: hypothetical protein D6814_11510 [Calditrichota bacterium]
MNGNVANGTSDENGYLILLGPDGEVLSQEKLTGAFGGINARVADLDHDGHQEILLMLTNALEPPRFRLEMRDAKSLKLLRSFALTGAAGFEIAQLNHEPEMEIVVDVTNGPLMILNAKFEVLQRKQNYGLMNRIDVVRDFTGDGLDDIVLYANDRDYLLDAQLNIKLEFENKVVVKPLHSKFQLYHDGSALPLVPVFDGQQTKLVTLERNRYYWLQIYGPPLGMLLSIGLFVGLIAFAMSHRRKARFYQYALEIESGLFNTPILILDPRMRLIFTNSYGADFFNIAPGQKKVAVAKLSLQDKRVSDFLQMLGTCDPVQQKLEVISDETPQEGFRIFAEPFGSVEERRPYWLVLVQDLTPETELQRAKTWAATAQRIAHDLKNPLSSMLLSVQRLQSEYRKHDPVAAKRYDPFVSRIINRIESLRRTSRNFMKFLSLEKLNLQPTQLKDLIDCFLKSGLVEFPPDIHLVTKFADDLPMIHVDQEQMQTLLENLITNAIDAMPDGGTLTISVFLENDLHLSHQKGPGDYVVVEVMDTGKGIPESVRDHLFKPYATGSPKGTGLGLTIVKKIVEDHDGFIEVNSEVETGTTFCIYLPLQVL